MTYIELHAIIKVKLIGGLAMKEIIEVIGIAGLIITAAWAMYSIIKTKRKISVITVTGGVLSLIVLISAVLFIPSQKPGKLVNNNQPTIQPTATPTKAYSEPVKGNTISNVMNEGFAAYDGKNIYFISNGIFRINLDGSGKTKISESGKASINILGDWMYFIDSGIYRMKKDGTEKTKICSDKAEMMYFLDDWIYFSTTEKKEQMALYKIKTDGSNKSRIAFNGQPVSFPAGEHFAVSEGMIYCIQLTKPDSLVLPPNTPMLHKLKCDGSSCDGVSYNSKSKQHFVISGSTAYFLIGGRSVNEMSMNSGGDRIMYNSNSDIFSINVYDKFIYFSKTKDTTGPGIFKMKDDGSGLSKITDSPCEHFCIVNDWIFFQSDGKVKKIMINGEQESEV